MRGMNVCLPVFVQTHRIYKSELWFNYGFWVIIMCQCRFITCNNVPAGGMLIVEEAVYVWGLGGGEVGVWELYVIVSSSVLLGT